MSATRGCEGKGDRGEEAAGLDTASERPGGGSSGWWWGEGEGNLCLSVRFVLSPFAILHQTIIACLLE